ncbi:Protein abrupt [Halotydeus destructor]|nr:Protein abrupt [Halotydeus destructor]
MAPEGQSESVIRFRRPDSVDTLLDNFRRLREEEQLLDVSLVCQGKVIRGHKLLLAATCDYFRSAFISLANTTCHTTAVIIKDMSYEDLENIVDFIYDGHIAIRATEVPSFIQSAEALQLTGIYYDSNCRDLSSTTSGKPSASKLFANATTLAADSTNMLIANSSAFNLRKILPTAAANMMNGSKLLPFIANHDESAELNQQYHHLLLPKSNYKREADNKSGLKQSYSSRRTSKESDLSSGVGGGGGGRHEPDSGQSGTASGHHGHQDDDDDDSLSDGEMMIEMPAGDGEATDSRGGDSDHHQLGGGGDHGSPLAEASCRSRPSSQGSGVGGSGDNQQIGYKMVIEEKFSDEEEATGGRDGNDGSDCAKDVESEETENVIDLSSNGNSSNSNQANCGEVYKHKKLKIASRLRNDTKSLSPSSLIRQTTQNGGKASDTGDNSKASLYRA